MKKLRIFFHQDYSAFTSKPLEQDFIEAKIHHIIKEDGFWFVDDGNGAEMLLTKDLLKRVTITLI